MHVDLWRGIFNFNKNFIFPVPACRAAPRDKKGQAEAPKISRGHLRKKIVYATSVFVVSVAAHHPAGSRAVVPEPPPSPALAAASPPLHALSALRQLGRRARTIPLAAHQPAGPRAAFSFTRSPRTPSPALATQARRSNRTQMPATPAPGLALAVEETPE